ncbi:MAG TPA: sugar transferase [Opitutaceae bacterium]|jgi:lipopolysaccharide/colanic/teichoic acid biosynthesis glycosyltransferase
MNFDSQVSLPQALLGHFESFQSRWGLRRLQTYVWLRRLAWRWLLDGAEFAKRGIDIVGSACALLMLSPILGLIAAAIHLQDRGPVLFPQTRVGRYGREFKMFKFRSMWPDAERRLADVLVQNHHQTGVTFKIKKDPRITPLGRYLRRFSLDELPQFCNVLIGEMSLVGPRPPLPREVALYTLSDRRRLLVKPGITCLWQISGRAEIDFTGQVKLDVNYIENQSLKQDLRILVKTVPAVIFGAGAY